MKATPLCLVLFSLAFALRTNGQASIDGRSTNSLSASTNQAAASQEELAPVAEWLRKHGTKDRVEAFINKELGLGNADIEVRKKGYWSEKDQMSYVAGVSASGDDLFLQKATKGATNAVLWLTSRKGNLRTTVLINQGNVTVVPNERFARGFDGQKEFFLEKARKDGFTSAAK